MAKELTTPFDTLPEDTRLYIQELREEAKTNRLNLEKSEAEKKRIQDEQLAKNQEWQTLAQQRAEELATFKPYKERAESLEAAFKANLDNRIAQIPDDKKDLIPQGLNPLELSKWLDRALPKLTVPTPPKLDGSAGGVGSNNSVVLSPEELDMCKRMGIKPEDYLKTKKA